MNYLSPVIVLHISIETYFSHVIRNIFQNLHVCDAEVIENDKKNERHINNVFNDGTPIEQFRICI